MATVLVTGFGPYGNTPVHPAQAVADLLDGETIGGASVTPGALVCNHLMYGALHHLAVEKLPVRAAWIHLPALPSVAALEENLGEPSMSAETSAAGVRAGITAALEHATDVNEPVRSRFQI